MFQVQSAMPRLTEAIGTSVNTYYDDSKKFRAISFARDEIIMLKRPHTAFAPDTTLTFTNLMADLPSGYLTWVKLWIDDTVYRFKNPNDFDHITGNYFTIKRYDATTRKIYVKENPGQTLNFRFIGQDAQITALTDWIPLDVAYINALAYFGAAKLAMDNKQSDADKMYKMAVELLQNASAFVKTQEEAPEDQRIKSVFESTSLFRNC